MNDSEPFNFYSFFDFTVYIRFYESTALMTAWMTVIPDNNTIVEAFGS